MNPRLSLIHEQTSPLFRIMSVYNIDEPGKRQFDNNRCAFHIGNGIVLSIAHTLRMPVGFLKSIDAVTFENEIAPKLDKTTVALYNSSYTLNEETGKRYIKTHWRWCSEGSPVSKQESGSLTRVPMLCVNKVIHFELADWYG